MRRPGTGPRAGLRTVHWAQGPPTAADQITVPVLGRSRQGRSTQAPGQKRPRFGTFRPGPALRRAGPPAPASATSYPPPRPPRGSSDGGGIDRGDPAVGDPVGPLAVPPALLV